MKTWKISQHNDEMIYDETGLVAICGTTYRTKDEVRDNAQLIAAAPELLEMLEDLDAILSTALHNGHHDLIERTKKILSKARGNK